jgi:3-methyl-2-oxobutanoate hydroxymethyltransferase
MSQARALTINDLRAMKRDAQRISMLTCYDATFAALMDTAGVEVILVGDSLGMVVQGAGTTVSVSVEDVAYHTRCVAGALNRTLLLSDLPFGSYYDHSTAMRSSISLMGAGAAMVKLEGAGPMVDVVQFLTQRGVSVCGHVGLTPQSVNQLGGFRVQGKGSEEAERVLDDAVALQQAGAQMLVVECVPASLGAVLSARLDIPVIGIGAGAQCDGQVLVMHDMLGLGDWRPKFVRNYMDPPVAVGQAFRNYVDSVRSGDFPGPEHQY